MATLANSATTDPNEALSHEFHAEAYVLSGRLKIPVEQEIRKQVPVALTGERGGHFYQKIDNYSLEGIISFRSGYTRVSGNPSQKKDHGWVTLSTSVLEGLNVLDVIKADRLVAQVSTDHPKVNGHVPMVTFLGTSFDNLQIGGYPVNVELDLNMCGEKPEDDRAYLDDMSFLNRVEWQRSSILSLPDLPKDLAAEYDKELSIIRDLKSHCNDKRNGDGRTVDIRCSLVKHVDPIPGVKIFGNVLQIPDFGIVKLAEVKVGLEAEKANPSETPSEHPESNYFTLTMLQMKMGCIGEGTANAGTANTNGRNKP